MIKHINDHALAHSVMCSTSPPMEVTMAFTPESSSPEELGLLEVRWS